MMLAEKLLFLLSVLFLFEKAKSKKKKHLFKKSKVKKMRAIPTDNIELR